MGRYSVQAYNTATQSENKIHDDAVAAKLGFTGGLVPGVDVYAYLCHLPAETWGADWLMRGSMRARFISPVYDGDVVEVEGDDVRSAGDARTMALTLRDSKGEVCAEATAALPVAADPAVPAELLPVGVLPDERPDAAEALPTLDVLGSLEVGFHADHVGEYLDNVREQLPLFRRDGFAHPAWLLRQANYVLSRTVKLGPWIHVESDMRHRSAARDGDRISVRGRVASTYERKGHRFVDLDVQWVAGERIVMEGRHTAIYQPRGVAAATA